MSNLSTEGPIKSFRSQAEIIGFPTSLIIPNISWGRVRHPATRAILAAEQVDGDTFRILGVDVTEFFTLYRWLRLDGGTPTVTAHVATASYTGGNTVVDVTGIVGAGTLPADLDGVEIGLYKPKRALLVSMNGAMAVKPLVYGASAPTAAASLVVPTGDRVILDISGFDRIYCQAAPGSGGGTIASCAWLWD